MNESLLKALQYCMLTELPEKEDKKSIWILAIALVQKKDGSKSYVYVEKNPENLENKIKMDFGRVVQIDKVLEYYPFSYLDARFMPTFEEKTKKETKIQYLDANAGKEPGYFNNMNMKEIDSEIIKLAVKNQLMIEKNGRQK